jgi:hypothetical protein
LPIDARSWSVAGTASPISASQKTPASANHGKRSAAGTKTSEPTTIATTQDRSGTGAPVAIRVAYAYPAAKIGAAATRTSPTPTREMPAVSWLTTPDDSERERGTKCRP